MTVNLKIVLGDRLVKLPGYTDSLVAVKHVETKVSGVYFHICDTTLFQGNFYQKADEYGYEMKKLVGFVPTFDTLFYAEKLKRVENKDDGSDVKTYYKSSVHTTMFGQPKDSIALDPFRMATFYYNGKIKKRKDGDYDTIIFAQPGLLEAQNYLEYTNYYKEYYFDRTYNRLLQLGLFSIIKPEVIEDVRTGMVEVHYYLVPAEKQSYSFEPRATNSNGFLGVSASVNYANKNLFRAGWITTISLSGGFESQPPVFDETIDGDKVQTSGRSFNTFEFGPSIKFDLPGFFPVNVSKLPKRSRPRTVLSAAYNYQRRPDFSREVLQMNFLWRLYVGKTQIVSAGVPFVSVIKFVSLDRTPEFEARIQSLNDLFLRNAYSDQLIWEDFKLIYDYDNKDKDNRKNEKLRWTFNTTFNTAGNTLSMFRSKQNQDTLGHYQAFGVNYSQFGLIDTKLVSYYTFNKRRVLAMRVLGGIGVPYGNTTTSLPYDYSFFAGGSNDNRGFLARSLGPGSYQYYMDSTRTATQIGDIRLGASLEFRLGAGFLNSAFFMDVDNIWTLKEDVNRPGSQFSKNWYKELGLTFGYGIRIDFEFFIVRADLGIPFTNPALPYGARWIFQKREPYLEQINDLSEEERKKIPGPFRPRLNIGIGFPF
jgi:outer membrane protein insertion porin family